MKKLVIGMLAAASFIFSANAQETGKMEHHKHHHGNAMMMKGLNLSAAQKEQMKANWQSTKKQMAELNKNEDITVREYKARKATILKSQKEQMKKLLTTEQKNQLAQNKSERKAKHELAVSKRLDKMKARLNLSDEQVTKMKVNREANMAKAKAIKENSQLSQTEKKEQLMAVREAQKNNFKEILTPEQISKMEEMKKDRMDKKSRK
ncbi:MAG: hypothetical protein ABI707_16790 [Ferruginibacter sp.]